MRAQEDQSTKDALADAETLFGIAADTWTTSPYGWVIDGAHETYSTVLAALALTVQTVSMSLDHLRAWTTNPRKHLVNRVRHVLYGWVIDGDHETYSNPDHVKANVAWVAHTAFLAVPGLRGE